jgi:hypothetical protein
MAAAVATGTPPIAAAIATKGRPIPMMCVNDCNNMIITITF